MCGGWQHCGIPRSRCQEPHRYFYEASGMAEVCKVPGYAWPALTVLCFSCFSVLFPWFLSCLMFSCFVVSHLFLFCIFALLGVAPIWVEGVVLVLCIGSFVWPVVCTPVSPMCHR